MTHQKAKVSDVAEPKRPLRADFTQYTLHHAVTAKRRANRKQALLLPIKELFTMKFKAIRTVPGAALALAVVATMGTGAYALTNWFGGNVTVTQADQSVLSVDLSDCKGNLPSGVDGSDRQHVQFKILNSLHISANDLQDRLLAQCEFDLVADFYAKQSHAQSYSLYASTIKAIDGHSVTLTYIWGGQTHEKRFQLANDLAVYAYGQPSSLQGMRAGDMVVFAVQPPANWQEDMDPLAATTTVQSLFKTQYDTRQAPGAIKNGFYEENNIMPLDMYNKNNK